MYDQELASGSGHSWATCALRESRLLRMSCSATSDALTAVLNHPALVYTWNEVRFQVRGVVREVAHVARVDWSVKQS